MRMTVSVLGILAALAPMDASAQDVWGEPTYGAVYLTDNVEPDPHRVVLRAGGPIDAAASLGGDCKGFIASRPDYRLTYASDGYSLLIFVEGQAADTTLVIHDPSGRWLCSDDEDGHNPEIVVFDSGDYRIWVGVFGGGNPEVTLFITEYY